MNKALVLLSGGIDSTVLASILKEEKGSSYVDGLFIKYGQKHQGKEATAAFKVATDLGIGFHKVTLPSSIFQGSKSSLLHPKMKIPKMSYEMINLSIEVSPTYVSFRNGLFISIAASMANIHKCSEIYIASHTGDSTAYPDCTLEFNGAMANAILIGTYQKIRLLTPFQWLTKSDIVGVGLSYSAPFNLTWSCYEGKAKACGKCPSCIERLGAFTANNAKDPIMYKEG